MAENKTEVLVGGLVLVAAVGFLFYAGEVTGMGISTRQTYDMTASFRSIEGVAVGTDVRLAGVKVGTVTDVALNPETFRADIRFTMQDNILLPEDTAALISSEGLLGGTFVELLPGGSPFNLEPGSEVEDTQSAVSLVQLLLRFVTSSGEEG